MNTNKWLCYGMLLAMGCSSSPPAGSSSPIRDLLHDTRGDLGVARNPDPTPGDVGLAPDIPSYGPDISADAIPILEDAGVQIADAAPVSDSEIPDLANLTDAIVILDPDAGDAAVLDPDAGDAAVIPEADAFIPPAWPRRVPGPCLVEFRDFLDPSGSKNLTYVYDDRENVISLDDQRLLDGFLTHTGYTNTYEENRLVRVEIDSSPARVLEHTYYLESGLLQTTTETSGLGGHEYNFAYDENGNTVSESKETIPGGREEYLYLSAYDDESRIVRREETDGRGFFWEDYTYSEELLIGIKTRSSRDEEGSIDSHVESRIFDSDWRVLEKVNILQNGSEGDRHSYTYDESGNILTERWWNVLGENEETYSTTNYDYSCWIP